MGNEQKTMPRSASLESNCTRRPAITSRIPDGSAARKENAALCEKFVELQEARAPACR